MPALLEAFLPYHDSPYFPRILAILTLPKSLPLHHVLHPLQSSPATLDRSLLVRGMLPAKDPSLALLREVVLFLPAAAREGNIHPALLTFWTATMVDFLERVRHDQQGRSEELARVLTEGLLECLKSAQEDEQLGVSGAVMGFSTSLINSLAVCCPPRAAAFRPDIPARRSALHRAPRGFFSARWRTARGDRRPDASCRSTGKPPAHYAGCVGRGGAAANPARCGDRCLPPGQCPAWSGAIGRVHAGQVGLAADDEDSWLTNASNYQPICLPR